MTTLAPKRQNGTSVQPAYVDPFDAIRLAMTRSFFEPIVATDFVIDMAPAVNVYEKDGVYTLECALAGYKKDQIVVEASGDTVTLKGTFSKEAANELAHYHRRELRWGSFVRTVVLPQEIDSEKVTAIFENGMLKLTLLPTRVLAAKNIPITG